RQTCRRAILQLPAASLRTTRAPALPFWFCPIPQLSGCLAPEAPLHARGGPGARLPREQRRLPRQERGIGCGASGFSLPNDLTCLIEGENEFPAGTLLNVTDNIDLQIHSGTKYGQEIAANVLEERIKNLISGSRLDFKQQHNPVSGVLNNLKAPDSSRIVNHADQVDKIRGRNISAFGCNQEFNTASLYAVQNARRQSAVTDSSRKGAHIADVIPDQWKSDVRKHLNQYPAPLPRRCGRSIPVHDFEDHFVIEDMQRAAGAFASHGAAIPAPVHVVNAGSTKRLRNGLPHRFGQCSSASHDRRQGTNR